MDFHISVTPALNISMNGARHIGYSIPIIKQIIQNAYRYITATNVDYQDVSLLFTIKSFFERGILHYYEETCESKSKLKEIKDLFIKPNRLSLKSYFSYSGFEHIIYVNGVLETVEDYILNILDNNFIEAMNTLQGDEIVKEWLSVKVDKAKETAKLAELKKLLK